MHYQIASGVFWVGALDQDRRLFDSLIPLPDGTSYNAYLVKGSHKTALIDTVDPSKTEILINNLEDIPHIDYVISHHAEQDHSGSLPVIMDRYPECQLLCSEKAREMLLDLLDIPAGRIRVVADGESLSLGNKTLHFIYTPWVHWPETMVTFLEEEGILFSCDFFGSHLATTDIMQDGNHSVLEAAKRYFAEIMMPFRHIIQKNLQKLASLNIRLIAPSHGPVHVNPRGILDAYAGWSSGNVKNLVIIPFVTMHESTRMLVDWLTEELVSRNIPVEQFNLTVSDPGRLAMALLDAATVIIGTPTMLAGPHPLAAYAAVVANALRPPTRFIGIIGSYGWGGKTVETLRALLSNMRAEFFDPILVQGKPKAGHRDEISRLAELIRKKHISAGLI
ncbi:FprA family A-type flavoprotein [Thermodesulforhabdus norvegica]|uniref:Flavorubredoxin n=1 Tax=Thermodesulforhabdus norvegica TaxID=39841 RepID=A0A1I4S3K8_9BACT|nr:FprA family A-type flavoprotein [Thermodesulforhabdus norvegica]SFM58833.1 Flavorubredoxin [Thermodesulforhabdus norvegica]